MRAFFFLNRQFRAGRRLRKLTPEQLQRESVRLDQLLQHTQREIGEREKLKAELFERGRQTESLAERESYARAIRRHDMTVRHMNRRLEVVHRHLHVIDGLAALRTTRGIFQRLRFGSVLSDLSVDQVARLAEDAAVDGSVETEKFERFARLLDGTIDLAPVAGHDPSLDAILMAMEQARTAGIASDAASLPIGRQVASGYVAARAAEEKL